MKAQGVTLAGSVIGGILASLCCIGPLVFALLGISGAAFAQRFAPLRPYFLVATRAAGWGLLLHLQASPEGMRPGRGL
jgi:mercuric ion transport protein